MRKQEEEQYETKLEWVKAHRFPEDTLADWYADKGIRLKYANIENRNNKRCVKCNYSTLGLHDQTLISMSGLKKKKRNMYVTELGFHLCEYCYNPQKQYNEMNEKTKINISDLGELEINHAKKFHNLDMIEEVY